MLRDRQVSCQTLLLVGLALLLGLVCGIAIMIGWPRLVPSQIARPDTQVAATEMAINLPTDEVPPTNTIVPTETLVPPTNTIVPPVSPTFTSVPTQTPVPPTQTPDLTPKNVALNKPVTIQTNGADEFIDGVGDNPSDVTDGSLDYEPVGNGKEDGSVAWPNAEYDEPIIIDVTIDLQEEYHITEIRYNMGNVDSAHVWHADSMTTPFGTTSVNPGSPHKGAWTSQKGSLVASQVTITLEKTRTEWNRDWFFIGEIEIYSDGAPLDQMTGTDLAAQEEPAVTQESSGPPNGRWEGSVNQSGASAYKVVMTLENCSQQAVCGEVDYPELSCGGTLTFLATEGEQYRLHEDVTYGTDGCADEGTITMLFDNADGSWAWHWYHESYGEATAILEKTE